MLTEITRILAEFQAWLEELPLILFWLAHTLLPVIGFPISILLVLSGARFPLPVAILFSGTSLLGSLFIAYGGSRLVIHPKLVSWIRKKGYPFPEEGQYGLMTSILVRMTPGVPFVVQNVILAILRVPIIWYVGFGWCVQMLYAVGFIVFGKGITGGNWGMAIAGLVMLAVIIFAIRKIRQKNIPQNDAS